MINLTKKNKWLALIALVVLAAAVFSVTFAWLAGSNIIKSTVDKGSILTSYFHTGDGSEENPFVITRPLHFYNMIYLYQRLEGFADEGYYFQLGYQLLYDENAQTPDENYYFYKYGDNGKIVPGQYSTVLNMAYYSDEEGMGGALLPIGTSDVPFLGTFDGKGLTVANLHVTGSETIGNDTLATSDIGIFGYVDEGATVKNTYFDGVTIDLSGLDPTSTTEDDSHDATHHDENKDGTPDLSYVGFLAGHIKTSSIVQNVYLNDCRVIGGDAARSGYGFFGCVEKADGTLVDSLGSEVATLRGEGDNAGFGGSIDMHETFQRLMSVFNEVRSTTSQYVTAETIVIDEVAGGSENKVSPSTTKTNVGSYNDGQGHNVTYKYYSSLLGGSFNFPSTNATSESGSGKIYQSLYGVSSYYTKTVTTYTYKDQFDEDGLLIAIGGSYLNATTSGLSVGNDADAATIWQLDGAGHLNALLEESTRYNTYYLNASANGTLSVSTSATTVWTRNEDANHEGTLTYTSGGRTWYLSLENGTWGGYPFDSAFSISNGANYLGQSNATTIAGTAGNHADWHFEDGKLMTFVGKTIYYLNASSFTLSVGTNVGSATTWTRNGNVFSYTDGNSRTWYLAYNNGWCCLPFAEGFTIANNTNYLGTTNGSTVTSVASGSALHFSLENGKLVTYYNNTLYYLNASAGALSLGTNAGSATTWTENDAAHTITYTDANSRTWYLVYDGTWHCVPFVEGFTIANNTNYLGYSGSAFTSTSAANALHFLFDNGKVVTFYNNTLYYLTASGATLSLTTSTPSITWVKGADTLSYTDASSRTWYLRCLNGAWDLYPSLSSYTIRSGNSYFGVSGANVTLTNQAGAANWVIEGNKLYTVVNGTLYYLVGSSDGSGTLSLNATRANGTDWTYTQGGGTMSYTANGETWYLYIRDGEWKVLPGSSYYLIAQSGNYLRATSTTAVDGTGAEDGSEWFIDGDGHIYTFYSGARRYLTASGSVISLSNSGTTVWTRNGNNTVTDVRGWYLVYDAGWKCYPELSYVLITDGTNYLTRNGNSGVTNTTTAASASRWFADGSKLYTVDDAGTKYYLAGNTTALSVTTTAGNGTEFTYDGTNKRLTYTASANTYYVIYNSGWTVNTSYVKGIYITTTANATTYYLNASTTAVSTGTDRATATGWTFNGSSGTVSTVINGTTYYLRAALDTNNKRSSKNLTVTTNAGQATTFTYSANNLTCQLRPNNTSTTYRLALDNGALKMVDTSKTYYTISINTNYFGMSGTSVTNYDAENASLWEFTNTNGNTYHVHTLHEDTYYYLRLSNSTIVSTSNDTVTYNQNKLSYKGSGWFSSTYYLRYNSGWQRSTTNSNNTITRTEVSFSAATVSLPEAHYETSEQAGSITATTTFTTTSALNNATFTAAANGTTQSFANVSENVTLTTSSVTENVTHTTAAETDHITLDYTAKRRQHIEKTVENNVSSGNPTYFPIRVDKDKNGNYPSGYAASPKNTGYIVSGANLFYSTDPGSNTQYQKAYGDIRVGGWEISNISNSWSTSGLTVTKIRNGNNYLYLEKNEETEEYSIANTTNADEANFWQYSGNKLFTTVGKTKYWLTYDNGLKLSETEGVEWTFSNSNRLAYNNNYIKYTDGAWVATANSQNLTVTLGTLNTVYTVDGNSNAIRELNSDELNDEAYKQAALQLSQSLATSGTRVFGLHFMDAAINMDHLVTAPRASIFGTEYTDYELPEDSVDFNVIERGSISFFAGEYFSGNNAFFSLHQVYRYKADDPAVLAGTKKVNDIKYIKEIAEVYKHATEGDSTNYVYKFSDNTYSNPDGTYTGANALAEGYSNTPVFKTTWITAPSGLNSNSKRIFFFKIPCNAGEYCLGSVSGKTGAYLIYLDIAANGGEELASAISGTGNDVVTSFQTEFRDAPDTMDHSVILLSYDAPDGATPETFSVSVNFDKTAAESLEDPHPSGLYTIDVVNKTGSDVTLYVYLCDDDFNLLTAFPYAYKVHYTNTSTGAGGTYLETVVGDTFQMMAGFTIPSSGEAIEVSYH